jgi:hypothetical protein
MKQQWYSGYSTGLVRLESMVIPLRNNFFYGQNNVLTRKIK